MLADLSDEFQTLCSQRPGMALEKLLRALLLQAFFPIRSERRLMAALEFNLPHRPSWSPDRGSCGDGSVASCG